MSEQTTTTKPSSLRERVKDKLLTPGGSFRYLARILSNEPALPARYPGKRISIACPPTLPEREKWYFPPEVVVSPRRVGRTGRTKDVPSSSPSQQSEEEYSRERPVEPRTLSSPPHHFSVGQYPVDSGEQKSLRVYDLRSENKGSYTDVAMELHSGLLYDLIQNFSSIWLTNPKIKESFIPLLRPSRATTRETPPAPGELRLV